LGPKIERLPDDHPFKPMCLFALSRLFESTRNIAECKRLFIKALKLWRYRGDDYHAAWALEQLSNTNRLMGLLKEGIQQVREALEVFERHGATVEQAQCLI